MVRRTFEPLKQMSSPMYEAEQFAFGSPRRRPRKRANEDCSDSPRAAGKRCRRQEASSRMLCPFYMRNPSKKDPEIKPSCHITGFAEIAKLRDHLKTVHQISPDRQSKLNFRGEPFRSLKDKEAKWKLAFQILFPEVPKDRIPSSRFPCTEPPVAVHAELGEITLDFNALRHLLENQFWAEYGTETSVPVIEFMQRFGHVFVAVTKMWLGLCSSGRIGIPTSVRHFQTILNDLPPVTDTTPDLAPYPLNDLGSDTPSESSVTIGNETCGSQVLSEGDEKQDFISPAPEYIKSNESFSESGGTELFTPLASSEDSSLTVASDGTLKSIHNSIILKKEAQELTLSDFPAHPSDSNPFDNPSNASTQGFGDLVDFSTLFTSSYDEAKLPNLNSPTLEANIEVSNIMEDFAEIYMDDFIGLDLSGWPSRDVDSSWIDSMDFPSMFS